MRGLKVSLEVPVTTPALPAATGVSPAAPAPTGAAPAPPAPPIIIERDLANTIAAVATGGPSRLALALTGSEAELASGFARIVETTRRRALHVRVDPGPDLVRRALAGLVFSLRERVAGRPGSAALLDALVKNAASFVLGNDLWSLEAFLAPEALDEEPAVASRILQTRFVPALAAQLPSVPRELVVALLSERTGSGSELAAIAGALEPIELLRALARIAARAGSAIVFSVSCSGESTAAGAVEAAGVVESVPAGVVWAIGCRKDSWELQRAGLDEVSRGRIEKAQKAPSAPLPVAAAPAAPGTGAAPIPARATRKGLLVPGRASAVVGGIDVDETPPLAIPRTLKLKKTLVERVKASVIRRIVANRKAELARVKSPARALSSESWGWRPSPTESPLGAPARALLVALPFVFLLSLGIFAKREEQRHARGPTPDWVIKLASIKGVPVAPQKQSAAPAPAASPQHALAAAPRAASVPAPAPAIPASTANLAPRTPTERNVRPVKFGATPGASIAERLSAIERMTQGPEQLGALCDLFDSKSDASAETSLLRRGVLLRLAPYRNEATALDRILGALEATNGRDVRLTAISALTLGNQPLAATAKTRLQAISTDDQDESVKNAAIILLAQQR